MQNHNEKPSGAELLGCLSATYFIDSEEPAVKEFAETKAGQGTELERGVRLYYAVRDSIRYDPYGIGVSPQFRRDHTE